MPSSKKRSHLGNQVPQPTDPVEALLEHLMVGKSLLRFRKGQTIFLQGDPADSIYFICKGKVKISVVSSAGKEAAVTIVGTGSFFGEGCLIAQNCVPIVQQH